MSEQLENQDAVETTEQNATVANPFDDGSWIDQSVNAEDYSGTQQQNDDTSNYYSGEDVSEDNEEEEIVDANEYLKNNLVS